jgi:hypothetical protein
MTAKRNDSGMPPRRHPWPRGGKRAAQVMGQPERVPQHWRLPFPRFHLSQVPPGSRAAGLTSSALRAQPVATCLSTLHPRWHQKTLVPASETTHRKRGSCVGGRRSRVLGHRRGIERPCVVIGGGNEHFRDRWFLSRPGWGWLGVVGPVQSGGPARLPSDPDRSRGRGRGPVPGSPGVASKPRRGAGRMQRKSASAWSAHLGMTPHVTPPSILVIQLCIPEV